VRRLSIEEAGDSILEIGKRMYSHGLVVATDGNLSVRISEDRILVTPTGMNKGMLSRSDLVVTNLKGERIGGSREPTSEIKMHIRAYELRDDIQAVVHAHPPYATGFAVAGIALEECVLPEIIVSIGSVPLAEYATPATEEMPRSIEEVVKHCDAFLLRNHGVMTVGRDLLEAYHKLEMVEHLAKITFIAMQLGGPRPLSVEDVKKLYSLREPGGTGPYPGCRLPGLENKTVEEQVLVRLIAEEVSRILKEGSR